MNLIEESWLAFRRRDGSTAQGPPAALADPEFVDLALPRADFRGAAWQFLIGLLQTAYAPVNRKEWAQQWQGPPPSENLQAALIAYKDAFHLFGDGPRFLQDLDPMSEARLASVAALLIEAPGEQALKQNTDHFAKRLPDSALCPGCAALALQTMQTNGPAGGTGYRVGLRGGGPLTTLVLPQDEAASLWQKLLLNVLPRETFQYPDPRPDDAGIFPWLAPTRSSGPGSRTPNTLPEDVHPLHVYWGMPNRVRLELDEAPAECSICGQRSQPSVRRLRITNYGYNYAGGWRHPLTPYRQDPKKTDPPISQKGQQGGLGYRHWESLVLEDTEQRGNLPARVVRDYLDTKFRALLRLAQPARQARLWVFGYDLKQNKPRGWYSTEMPLIALDSDARDLLLSWVRDCTQAADKAAWQTRAAIKAAWFSRPQDAKGDFTFIDHRFWEATSAEFFAALDQMAKSLSVGATRFPPAAAARWAQVLRDEAEHLFDDLALSGDNETQDLKRAIAARNGLHRWLRGGKEMKQLRQQAQEEADA